MKVLLFFISWIQAVDQEAAQQAQQGLMPDMKRRNRLIRYMPNRQQVNAARFQPAEELSGIIEYSGQKNTFPFKSATINTSQWMKSQALFTTWHAAGVC